MPPSATEPKELGSSAEHAPRATYRALVDRALEAQRRGDYPEMHAAFAEAHALEPSARTLRGMGTASFQAGRYARAVVELEAALTHPSKPLDTQLRRDVETLLVHARLNVGVVVLIVMPEHAEVLVDREEAPRLVGAPLVLEGGSHSLRFFADGHVAQTLGIEVTPGARQSIHLQLVPEFSPPPPSEAQVAILRAPDPIAIPLASLPPSSRVDGSPKKSMSPHAWRMTGVAASFAIAGASALTAVALSVANARRLSANIEACEMRPGMRCTAEEREELVTESRMDPINGSIIGTTVLAASSLAAGGALLLWDHFASKGRNGHARLSSRKLGFVSLRF